MLGIQYSNFVLPQWLHISQHRFKALRDLPLPIFRIIFLCRLPNHMREYCSLCFLCSLHSTFQARCGKYLWSSLLLTFVVYLYTLFSAYISTDWTPVSKRITRLEVVNLTLNCLLNNMFGIFSISFHVLRGTIPHHTSIPQIKTCVTMTLNNISFTPIHEYHHRCIDFPTYYNFSDQREV